MFDFDPNAEFESVVRAINRSFSPGGHSSGPARNAVLWAWTVVAGKRRVKRELQTAIERHGSRTALLRAIQMSPRTFRRYQDDLEDLEEASPLPTSADTLRAAFSELPKDAQLSFASLAAEFLAEPELLGQLTSSARPITRMLELGLRVSELNQAAVQLQELLDTGVTQERHYQRWCDEHSWVFAGAHRPRDAVRQIDRENVVDLLLPDVVGFRDIIELKRPDVDVLKFDRSHRTHFFSSDVSKAIGQVHKYMDRLQRLARDGLPNNPHIFAYHPRAYIVIGRSNNWPHNKLEALRGLNERMHGIDVLSYDHLLARAKTLLANFDRRAGTAEQD